jgi:poly(3-hydroxybutyrate) depolymerase
MMPFALLPFVIARAQVEPIWRLSDCLTVTGVARGGRSPFSSDELLADAAKNGGFRTAKEGELITGPNGDTHPWHAAKADAKGNLARQPGGGYVQAVIPSDSDQDAILTVSGDGSLFFNGEPRPGDVYGYGYLSLPVHLHKGDNLLLVSSGRGALHAQLDAPKAPLQFNLADSTLPDVLTTDTGDLMGAVVVLNSTGKTLEGLRIRTKVDGSDETAESALPPIGPYTLRKVPFKFPAVPTKPGDKEKVELTLNYKEQDLDTGEIQLDVRGPLETHKRTFISNIDGSLQYYAVVPAQKPSRQNALVLTLHGASVEAIGQARAYQAKDWCTIVAPTNRRPYGFDWEDIGRLDAIEVLNIAKKAYLHDPARVALTGHSMGGHGTWSIGTLYPNLFAAICPSAGWISFQSYAGGYAPTDPNATQQLLLDSASASDTMARDRNTLEENVYILHGAVDDNVPVTEARTMKKALEDIGTHLEYHEQPGANHWWGNQCVDWPPLFAMIQKSRLKAANDPSPIDFTTPNPAISSTLRWVTIYRQDKAGQSWARLKVEDGAIVGTTNNVEALELRKPAGAITHLTLDGETMPISGFPVRLERREGAWAIISQWERGWMSPSADGPFKAVFDKNFVFVVGTRGPGADKLMALARYEAESMYYRGNGAIDVMTDDDYVAHMHSRDVAVRNVLLFGNADTNGAWKAVAANAPIQGSVDSVSLGGIKYAGARNAWFEVSPHRTTDGGLLGVVGFENSNDAVYLSKLPLFFSGVAFPDYAVFDVTGELSGSRTAIQGIGDFGADWGAKDGINLVDGRQVSAGL